MTTSAPTNDARITGRLAAALPGLVAVYRFGSTATGTEYAGSDVDLAVLADGPVDPEHRFDLQEQLAADLGRDVDLVDLARASTVLAVEVVGRGVLLLDADPERRGAFEDLALASYARLNEERRGILERVAAEGPSMADDVLLARAASIERCVLRIREVHGGEDRNLFEDTLRQESILLNLQRACETAIDLAMHLIRVRRLGVPQESREAFALLEGAGLLSAEIATRMKRMVGFRNIAVHEYRQIDLAIVRAIVHERLDDFLAFTSTLLRS